MSKAMIERTIVLANLHRDIGWEVEEIADREAPAAPSRFAKPDKSQFDYYIVRFDSRLSNFSAQFNVEFRKSTEKIYFCAPICSEFNRDSIMEKIIEETFLMLPWKSEYGANGQGVETDWR